MIQYISVCMLTAQMHGTTLSSRFLQNNITERPEILMVVKMSVVAWVVVVSCRWMPAFWPIVFPPY
jgi:hypothetical protein